MTAEDDNRNKLSFNMPIGKGWVIFNEGNNQTKGDPGFDLVNNGIYGYDGFIEIAGISSPSINEKKIYASEGVLYINSNTECVVNIVTLAGVVRSIKLVEGLNIIDYLPKGFYIVDGKKVIL